MKILTCKVNNDGHYELFVEYEKTVTVGQAVIIVSREMAIRNASKGEQTDLLTAMSEEAYLNDALIRLRAELEDVKPVDMNREVTVKQFEGRVIAKK